MDALGALVVWSLVTSRIGVPVAAMLMAVSLSRGRSPSWWGRARVY
jgi:hypothetical protein